MSMALSRKEETETIKHAVWVAISLCIILILSSTIGWNFLLGHLYYRQLLAKAKGPGDFSNPQRHFVKLHFNVNQSHIPPFVIGHSGSSCVGKSLTYF